jgi:hypothetical protein
MASSLLLYYYVLGSEALIRAFMKKMTSVKIAYYLLHAGFLLGLLFILKIEAIYSSETPFDF